MKLKTLNIFSLMLIGVLVMLSSCEKEDDYNFNAIEPVIFNIEGPGEVSASGLQAVAYKVAHRGGSSYVWEVGGHGGQVVPDEDIGSIAYVTFNQASDTLEGLVTVTETTAGGITSDSFTKSVVLLPFCPEDMEPFVGNWTGTSGNHDEVLVASTTDVDNELHITGLAGFVNFAWGENWTEGDGSCVMEFRCNNQVVIENQWIGDSDYPDTYYIDGEGTYNPDELTIELSYKVYYTGSSTGDIETTLTKDAKTGLWSPNKTIVK